MMDNRQMHPEQEVDVEEADDRLLRKVLHGRVSMGNGVRATLHQLIKAGLAHVERPPSKHRLFTHSNRATTSYRQRRKRRRNIAKASRRRNQPPKRRTGVRPVR